MLFCINNIVFTLSHGGLLFTVLEHLEKSGTLCPVLVSFWSICHVLLPSLKFTISIHLSLLLMTSTVLILAVCKTPVTYELSSMTLLSMRFCTSVDGVSTWCLGGSWTQFLSGTQIFFLFACSCHIDQFTFHILLTSLQFAIFIHLSWSWEVLEALRIQTKRATILTFLRNEQGAQSVQTY